MAITLLDAKAGMADKVDQQVVDMFRRSSLLLDSMVFDNAISPGTGGSTLTYGYIQLKTPATAAVRNVGAEYLHKEAKKVKKTTSAVIMGGSFEIDRVLQNTSGAMDELAFQAEQKIKATANFFHDLVINGDTSKGTFDGLHVGIVGDIAHSRVCGSLIPALKTMGCEVTVIAPQTLLPARPDVLGVDHVSSKLDEVLPELDVVYMLRIQRERLEGAPFPSLREYSMLYGLNKDRDELMKPDAIVCHPGPINRGVELDSYMADHPTRSIILDQVYAGVLVRMAVLYLLLGGSNDGVDA